MGDIKLALFLAYKSIFGANRWALALIVLVMSLSFANLLLVPSILAGVTETINRQQVDALYGDIVIDPLPADYYLNGMTRMVSALESVPGVTAVAPRIDSSALIESDWKEKDSPADRGKSGTWPVTGVEPDSESGVTSIARRMIAGEYLAPGDRDAIILGVEIAGGEMAATADFETLQGTAVGDHVRLTYPNGVQREYTVKGIFRAQESRADRMAFVTRTELSSVLGRAVFNDRASQLLVKTTSPGLNTAVLEQMRTLGLSAEIRSWEEYGSVMASVVKSFDMIADLIGGIGLVVAGIVMFIVIYINVVHSRRHIGILRAIGIKRDVIISSYLLQAFFYAAMGIVLGGLAFHLGIQSYFHQYPLDMAIGKIDLTLQPQTIRSAVIGLLAAAVLAGLIPVFSITRQGIIQAIWGH